MRARPADSMEGFMSDMVTLEVVSEWISVQWSNRRRAMSPVPEATSRMDMPLVVEEGEEGEVWGRPGLRERTK